MSKAKHLSRLRGKEGQALEVLREAAGLGSPEAQHRIFVFYATQRGLDGDEALRNLQAAADQGYEPAIFDLARCYESGFLVKKDQARAAALKARLSGDE